MTDRVTLIAPTGTRVTVAASAADRYIGKGYRRPDGRPARRAARRPARRSRARATE